MRKLAEAASANFRTFSLGELESLAREFVAREGDDATLDGFLAFVRAIARTMMEGGR